MKKAKELSEKQIKLFRYYRLFTIWLISLVLALSIWTIMINNINWTFSDVAYPLLALMIVVISGMYANANNNFPLLHIRGIRITKERLTSILIGLFFPIVFLIYIMVNDESFMDYVNNITLHNFITLCVYGIPVFLFITMIIYFGYLVVSPKTKRKSVPQYKEETELSLDFHKKTAINIVLLFSFISLWTKLALSDTWGLSNIFVELIVIFVIFAIRIIANRDNKLPWNYRQGKALDKVFFISLLIPYILIAIYYLISSDFRLIVSTLEVKTLISTLVYLLPLFVLGALTTQTLVKCQKKAQKDGIKITKKIAKRNENILLSIVITAIFILLLFIYIITKILTDIDLEILLQIWTILIPLSVIIYIVIYYSVKDINK